MLNWIIWNKTVLILTLCIAHMARAVEYTDCASAEGQPHNESPEYDTKQSDGEVPVMLELWGMRSTRSLPLLPDPLWPRMVAPDRSLSMGWIELNCILMLNWIVWMRTVWLNWIAWNRNVFDIETVLTFKLISFAKLNCLKYKCFWHWKCTYTKLNCLI